MQQTICDGCGEPIDTTGPYYTGQVQQLDTVDGVLTNVGQRNLDWHIEHLPAQDLAPDVPEGDDG